jgi:hypothetical protein
MNVIVFKSFSCAKCTANVRRKELSPHSCSISERKKDKSYLPLTTFVSIFTQILGKLNKCDCPTLNKGI